MKKVILALIGAILLTSCGVGSYTVSSGKADVGMISFVSDSQVPITVTIDDKTYDVLTVKEKAWRTDRNIKKTAKNTITLSPGQHTVVVAKNGQEVYSKKVFISVQEHKVIEL